MKFYAYSHLKRDISSVQGCIVTGILPLVIAVCALGLIFIHWLQLRKLRAHVKLPEVTQRPQTELEYLVANKWD